VSILLLTIAAALLAILAGGGLWLIGRNLPIFTVGDPILPDEEDKLDGEARRAYAAQVHAATGGRGIATLVRRRLFLSLAGVVLVLGAIAGTLWFVQG
jgi:uncharacterized membrane protein YdfJ with MMPL/SSD domain